ncbi:MAG: PRC-barrel domain-containing protein [Rubrobacteraceae bacterium]
MEERNLVGLEARTAEGEEVGRISEVLTDEDSGEVTHVVLEREDERFEVPVAALSFDEEADFATFHADRSDEEPGDHTGDRQNEEDYAPLESGEEDYRHEGQFTAEPESPEEAQAPEDLVREDWEDETYTPDSGYPRNDAYIDPDTGEEETDPAMKDNEGIEDDVADLLDGTELRVRSVKEGVVELTGAAGKREDLAESVEELMGLDGVLEVDTTDVAVG